MAHATVISIISTLNRGPIAMAPGRCLTGRCYRAGGDFVGLTQLDSKSPGICPAIAFLAPAMLQRLFSGSAARS
jgi:hypothetical protein